MLLGGKSDIFSLQIWKAITWMLLIICVLLKEMCFLFWFNNWFLWAQIKHCVRVPQIAEWLVLLYRLSGAMYLGQAADCCGEIKDYYYGMCSRKCRVLGCIIGQLPIYIIGSYYPWTLTSTTVVISFSQTWCFTALFTSSPNRKDPYSIWFSCLSDEWS